MRAGMKASATFKQGREGLTREGVSYGIAVERSKTKNGNRHLLGCGRWRLVLEFGLVVGAVKDRRLRITIEVVSVVHGFTGAWIKNEFSREGLTIEVEHVEQRSREDVVRTAADAAKAPVVFDEAKNGALIGERAVNKVDLGPGRDDK
jgi:hypothetical protein